MVAPDLAAQSETHRETKEKEPIKLGLHASINPDTLPFTYAKDKHVLSFTVENTGESMEIFKIKTTASYLYRIRPVFFKLGVRERQEVSVIYKGIDAGPIPLSAKDRITVVFAHALDPRKSTTSLWEMHKPFAHLSYAESREYVRVLFVDETGRLAVAAAQEKSRGGLKDQRSAEFPKSITVRPEPPRRTSVERDMTEQNQEEKSNNDYEDAPSSRPAPPPAPKTGISRTPRSPGQVARTPGKANRTPSPNTSRQSPKDSKKKTSGGKGAPRDPIESLLNSVTKDASAIVCVQYPGKGFGKDDGSTYEDEDTKKDEESKKQRDMDTDARREGVMRKKMEEMRRRESEERNSKKKEEQRKEEKKRSEERKREKEEREERKKKEEEREERKRKEEEREERKRKEEEREERKRKEEDREERKRKEEDREERRKKEEEREERKRKEEEKEEQERRKKEDDAEDEKASAQKSRRSSNEEIKQEAAEESPVRRSSTPRRRVLGADGYYHDDDSRYLDEEIRRKHSSVRMLKKGGRTANDNSAEDDKPIRRASLEDDN